MTCAAFIIRVLQGRHVARSRYSLVQKFGEFRAYSGCY